MQKLRIDSCGGETTSDQQFLELSAESEPFDRAQMQETPLKQRLSSDRSVAKPIPRAVSATADNAIAAPQSPYELMRIGINTYKNGV
jgi:hypothetical protein